jgi:hypothetical protein
MGEVFGIFLVVTVIAVTFFVFVLWAIALITRGIGKLLWRGTTMAWRLATGSALTPPELRTGLPAPRRFTSRCHNDKCRAPLPASARFCVRCGTSTSVTARRVA